jgi:hypothetical protein
MASSKRFKTMIGRCFGGYLVPRKRERDDLSTLRKKALETNSNYDLCILHHDASLAKVS